MGHRLAVLTAAAVVVPLFPSLLAAQGAPPAGRSAASGAAYDPRTWAVPWGAEGRPRDPYVDATGRVWFVGQAGNYVASFDPRTQQFRRYAIDPGTNPHNLVVERGQVWFTGNRNGRLVRLDPATGRLTTYAIPDSSVRDPHTMTFDPRTGVAWFTAQNAGAVGRFDPATGAFRIWKTGAGTRPYGIVLDATGQPWFDLFGTNRLGTIDPATMALRTVALPDEGARPRRIAITRSGALWWGDYVRGMLGRLDPGTGAMREWPLPLGRASLPYAMTSDDRDLVWVAQAGESSRPATLVAFDPKAGRFVAEVPVGRPGGNTIRHMTFDPKSRQIWFGTDQGEIGRIVIPPRDVVP